VAQSICGTVGPGFSPGIDSGQNLRETEMDPLKAVTSPSDAESAIISDELEKELGRQILISEKLRAALQAGMGAAIFVILAIVGGLYLLRATPLPGYKWALVIVVVATAYELITRKLFDYQLRRDARAPLLGRYLNAVIETSIPTVVILVFTQTSNPDVALTSAASYAYYFFIILSALRLDFWLSAFTGFVAALGYVAITIWFEDQLFSGLRTPQQMVGYVMRPTFLLLGGVIAGLVAKQIKAGIMRAMHATEERRQIVQMFGQHVSPAVVNRLLAQPTGITSELRLVCVLVLDIRNFTSFAETASPDAVVGYLNRLWASCVEVVNRNHGIVNKFLGDGFMAVFGAPLVVGNSSANAVRAARQILEEVEHSVAAGEIPPTQLGLGLHAGEALVGNIGSSQRREYTVIGDVVNVAFRIEQLNKEFGSTLLISESVQQATQAAASTVEPASLQIRGRQSAIQVYKLA
jgi:adenylate cyclase